MTDPSRPRHPALAATLSFLFPGLGQAYAGQRELALLLASPVLLLVASGAAIALFLGDELRNELLSSSFLAAALGVDVLLLAWRLFAIMHAAVARPDRAPSVWPDATTVTTVAVLSVLAVAMHIYFGVVLGRLDAALDRVFVSESVSAAPPAAMEAPPEDAESLNTPEYRWDGTERLNFLLLGLDSGVPDRSEALADTVLVVSVDPVAQDAIMVSIPRDTGFMPLPDGRIYADGLFPEKINILASTADDDPERWCPDLPAASPDCGIRTLERSVGLYLGITIHYYATVDLVSFEGLIDSIGGVQLCLPGRLVDPRYVGTDRGAGVGIELPEGCRRYGGEEALAFARIRSGTLILPDGTEEPQDDFKRAGRQQEVLLALRRELAAADLFFELPALLEAIGRTVSSDFPRNNAGDLASLLPLITGPDIERVVLGAPEFVDLPVAPETNYLLIPRRDAIRTEAERLFGDEGALEGWYVGSRAPSPPRDREPASLLSAT